MGFELMPFCDGHAVVCIVPTELHQPHVLRLCGVCYCVETGSSDRLCGMRWCCLPLRCADWHMGFEVGGGRRGELQT